MNPVIAMKEEILFPGKILNIHIIPTTTVVSIERHLASDETLIAIPQRNPNIEPSALEDLADCGCTAKIIKTIRLGDGTLQVLMEGLHRVKIEHLQEVVGRPSSH